jgi:hypothetical protein
MHIGNDEFQMQAIHLIITTAEEQIVPIGTP